MDYNTKKRLLLFILLINFAHGDIYLEIIAYKETIIPCQIFGEKISWLKNGRQQYYAQVFENGSMFLDRPRKADEGYYECCSGEPIKMCAVPLRLSVSLPENADIIEQTIALNRNFILKDYIYWLPKMSEVSRSLTYIGEPITLSCHFFLRSDNLQPNASWLYLTREEKVRKVNQLKEFNASTIEYPCVEEALLKFDGSRCFATSITINPLVNLQSGHFICRVSVYDLDKMTRNELEVSFTISMDSSTLLNRLTADHLKKSPQEAVSITSTDQLIILYLNELGDNRELTLFLPTTQVCRGQSLSVNCSRPLFFNLGKIPLLIYQLSVPQLTSFYKNLVSNRSDLIKINPLGTSFTDVIRFGDTNSTISHPTVSTKLFFQQPSINVIACTYQVFITLALVQVEKCEAEHWSGVELWLMIPLVGVIFGVLLLFLLHKYRHNQVQKTISRHMRTNPIYFINRDTKSMTTTTTKKTSSALFTVSGEKERQASLRVNKQWDLPAKFISLQGLIANGSFGAIHLGYLRPSVVDLKLPSSSPLPTTVVVKTLQSHVSVDKVQEFVNEIAVLRFIGAHSFIIRLIGCCQKASPSGLPIFVLEYASRGSLHDFFQRQFPLEADDLSLGTVVAMYAADVGRTLLSDLYAFSLQVCQAMAHLESFGIVHCDLAARNVLLTAEFTTKLSDFGLSTFVPHGEFKSLAVDRRMAFRWAAPEVHMNKVHAKSDVWSFGVLLWEIFSLARCPPYCPFSQSEVIKFINSDGKLKKPLLANVPLYTFMRLHCWALVVDQRPSFAEIFKKLSDLNPNGYERLTTGYLVMN